MSTPQWRSALQRQSASARTAAGDGPEGRTFTIQASRSSSPPVAVKDVGIVMIAATADTLRLAARVRNVPIFRFKERPAPSAFLL